MDRQTKSPRKRTWLDLTISQILGLLVCIGVPALVTAIAPVSWIKFQRSEDRVTAQARTCLLFVIPFETITVDPVTEIGDRTHVGTVSAYRRRGDHDNRVRSEDEGFLVIQGPNQKAEVQVTPFNLESVVERSEAFLKNPQATELKLFVVANWKFSVIGGGLVSLLTVIYLGACVVTIGQWLLRGLGFRGKAVSSQQ